MDSLSLPASDVKPSLRPRYEGLDGSGSVLVVMDNKCMVIDVDVCRNWKQKVTAEDFAAAVFQAYSLAMAAHLEDAALGELSEVERDVAAHQEKTVNGPHGYLKVVHHGQEIKAITGDPVRIREAEGHQLRSEALQALHSAQHDEG